MTRKKVLVTGGCGFIGHNLVLKLVESCDVRVVDSLVGGDFRPRVEGAKYKHFDIADAKNGEALANACDGVSHVFHLAALPKVEDSYDRPLKTFTSNVLGTAMVLDAARKAKVGRVVFASSSAVYGDSGALPLHEDTGLYPMSPYAHHKNMGEQLCDSFSAEPFNLQTVCLRFFNVYGPGADPNGAYASVVARFLEQKGRGVPLTVAGDGTQTRDFVHVDDVVRAMIMAAECKKEFWAEALNVGAGKQVSVKRIAELIGGPIKEVEARQEPHDSLACIRRIRERLGWEPLIPPEEGIRRLLESGNPRQ